MNKSKSIVKQAGILAIAGILVRVIGVLYRSPLTAMIGDVGNGYYSTAYNIYALVLLISSYSIPTAISKLISEKLALNQYNNVKRIFQCALIYIAVVCGVASLLTFILAPFIVKEGAVFALRILCPTIFLSGLVGVMRGYFQAYSTTVYTSISQILEQVFNAIVSVGAAYLFIQPYLNNAEMKAVRGAGGSALGTGAGVLVALLFMFFTFMRKGSTMVDSSDIDPHVDTTKEIFSSILSIVTPIIFATCVYNLCATLDMFIYYGIMDFKNMDSTEAVKLYGVYAGKYTVLMNVPVALASAMSAASIPAISGSYALENYQDVRVNIENSISVTMLIIIPCAVGLAVLSYPIMGLLFPQPETLKIASTTLTIGAAATIFYGLSTITNGVLQAIGAVKVPLHNAIIALICHVILLVIMLFIVPGSMSHYSLYVLAIGTTFYALQMCVTNQIALRNIVQYKYRLRRVFGPPLIASIVMGICAYGSYQGLFFLTRKVAIPLFISIFVGVVVYFAIILYLYKEHRDILDNIPYMDKIMNRVYKS